MAGRKLVRDLHLYRQPLFLHLTSQQQVSRTRSRSITAIGFLGNRRFSFNEFSKQVKGEVTKIKEAKLTDLAKKGYGIVKDELSGDAAKRKHLEFDPYTIPKVETSSRTDIVVVPRSRFSNKWEAFKLKMQSNPTFKHLDEIRKPITDTTQEIVEVVRQHWETSNSRIVHKIQDITKAIVRETDSAASIKEIRCRDRSFSLPDLLAEVQGAVKPVLNAYIKGDLEALKKNCSNEVIERCKAEHDGFKSHGIFFDHKILHVSEAEVKLKDIKMMGSSPIIIVKFQTQQVYCVRDRNGEITDGGKDTIHTVHYAWAMQLVDPEELGEGANHPIWKVREMQQFGVPALI